MGEIFLTQSGWKFAYSHHQKKIPPINSPLHQISNTIKTSYLVIAPVPILFWTSYSLYTHLLLILILIYAQYFWNVVLIFEKGSNAQNYSTSDSHHYIKISPSKTSHPSPLGKRGRRAAILIIFICIATRTFFY